MNMHVIITGRNEVRLAKAVEMIKKQVATNTRVEFMLCDQSSLASVTEFVNAFKAKSLPLHILVLNGGGMFYEPYFGVDDVEYHLQVNHLSHFYMAVMLVDVMKNTPGQTRIVTVSSLLHLMASGVEWNELAYKEAPGLYGYATSKLANVLFARALGKRLKGTNVRSFVVHPGYSKTEGLDKPGGWIGKLNSTANYFLATPASTGASAQIYAATNESLNDREDMHTKLIGPMLPFSFTPQTFEYSPQHLRYVNDHEADRLWEWSRQVVCEKTHCIFPMHMM